MSTDAAVRLAGSGRMPGAAIRRDIRRLCRARLRDDPGSAEGRP